ncbi:hypothetical protein SLA2020_282200, partial [Shorea laevis]
CRMAVKKGSSPLDAPEIRAAILIVQHLAEAPFCDQQVKVYLPDVSGRLLPASDLVYNDAPWLLGSEDPDNSFLGASNLTVNMKRTFINLFMGTYPMMLLRNLVSAHFVEPC